MSEQTRTLTMHDEALGARGGLLETYGIPPSRLGDWLLKVLRPPLPPEYNNQLLDEYQSEAFPPRHDANVALELIQAVEKLPIRRRRRPYDRKPIKLKKQRLVTVHEDRDRNDKTRRTIGSAVVAFVMDPPPNRLQRTINEILTKPSQPTRIHHVVYPALDDLNPDTSDNQIEAAAKAMAFAFGELASKGVGAVYLDVRTSELIKRIQKSNKHGNDTEVITQDTDPHMAVWRRIVSLLPTDTDDQGAHLDITSLRQ